MATTEKKSPSSGTYIPLPVTDSPVPAPKTTRRRRFITLTILLLAFHLFVARPTVQWYRNSREDAQELSEHSHPSRPHRPHHPKKHFIWGKEAEELYL